MCAVLITARSSYARAVLGIVLLSIRLSVCSIGGGACELRRLVPPQNFVPGGTLWSVPPQNFCYQLLFDPSINHSFTVKSL